MLTPTPNDPLPQRIRAVVFDWRGTLVSELDACGWVREALRLTNRDHDDHAVDTVLKAIHAPELLRRLQSPQGNTSAQRHRETYYGVFTDAGLEKDVADALWDIDSSTKYNHFAADAADTIHMAIENGCKIGVLSNIHFDIRPVFDAARLLEPIDAFILSNEVGVQKPDPAIFQLMLDELGTDAAATLMVGDRPSRDGAAAAVGMPTLIVPPLTDPAIRQLHIVEEAILAGHAPAARTA
ncbi:HAD family hydrolase [Nocardia sp. NPDC056000]|uniref:HAD family hydrolase n=1 Tax=Nocardia sp. NPDC056000 TaxID=3345674 RepID=UPI0035E12C2D